MSSLDSSVTLVHAGVAAGLTLIDALVAARDSVAAHLAVILPRSPGPVRLLSAIGVVIAYVTFSLLILRVHWRKARRAADETRDLLRRTTRTRAAADDDADRAGSTAGSGLAFGDDDSGLGVPIVIAFASQTGFAEQLARKTAETLAAADQRVGVVSFAHLDTAILSSGARILFVVSTTGEGDAPDSAAAFVRKVMPSTLDLSALHFGVLALGDRAYVRYCAFGHALDAWLRHHGATPLFDLVEVDDGDEGALRHWQHHLRTVSGRADLADWDPPRYGRWRLIDRRLLNDGSPGGPAYHLVLEATTEGATWRAGDIAEIGPRHAPEAVAPLLQTLGLDGAAAVEIDGCVEPLAQALATRVLPHNPAGATDAAQIAKLRALGPRELIAALPRLPHRAYSIASLPDHGRMELLVRQVRHDNGGLGLGSGWLTAHAPIGSEITLRVRENEAFHPPAADCPLILIGNGTGLAGLRAHLAARAAARRHRNWLLFGERTAQHDFFFQDEIDGWRERGVLTHCDVAFSRDRLCTRDGVVSRDARGDAAPPYVQDLVRHAADDVRAWVAQGAAIYVCGSLHGMSAGVHAALIDVLGEPLVEELMEAGRYRRDVY